MIAWIRKLTSFLAVTVVLTLGYPQSALAVLAEGSPPPAFVPSSNSEYDPLTSLSGPTMANSGQASAGFVAPEPSTLLLCMGALGIGSLVRGSRR